MEISLNVLLSRPVILYNLPFRYVRGPSHNVSGYGQIVLFGALFLLAGKAAALGHRLVLFHHFLFARNHFTRRLLDLLRVIILIVRQFVTETQHTHSFTHVLA